MCRTLLKISTSGRHREFNRLELTALKTDASRSTQSVWLGNRSRLIMKKLCFSILLTGPAQAGSPGQEFFLNEGAYWPIAGCQQDKACYAWKIKSKPGWEDSNAVNLR